MELLAPNLNTTTIMTYRESDQAHHHHPLLVALLLTSVIIFTLDIVLSHKMDRLMCIHHSAVILNLVPTLVSSLLRWDWMNFLCPQSLVHLLPGYYLECFIFVNYWFRIIKDYRPKLLPSAAPLFALYFVCRVIYLWFGFTKYCTLDGEWLLKLSSFVVAVVNTTWLWKIVSSLWKHIINMLGRGGYRRDGVALD